MIREAGTQVGCADDGSAARARLNCAARRFAMQVHPGVFVSNISTEEWQADPEIGGGAEEHVLVDTGAMRAG
jgi:hypothetical protein